MANDPSVQSVSITRYETTNSNLQATSTEDAVSIEAPLDIRINEQPWTMTMRTPGQDRLLVLGLLFSEGIISGTTDIQHMRPTHCENAPATRTMDVNLQGELNPDIFNRSLRSTAACGLCGKTSFSPSTPTTQKTNSILPASQVLAMLDVAKRHQADFDITGGLHAAAAFTLDGDLLAIHEDIGRHNALDKLVGQLITDNNMASPCLVLSGRVSWEMIQKAARYGFSHIMAVSAPSSMAIDMAHQHGITLIAWCRDQRFSVYTHTHQLQGSVPHEC